MAQRLLNLNYAEAERLKKLISNMNHKELSLYLQTLYQAGFNDCKEEMGMNGSDVYIWDEEQIYSILRKNYLTPELCDRIMKELMK